MEIGPDNHEGYPDEDDRLLRPEMERPAVTIEHGEVIYNFTWDNTELWTFSVGNGQFDHVRHTIPDDTKVCIFLASLSEGELFRSRLAEEDFPLVRRPELDELTIELYSRAAAINIDPESGAILQPEDKKEVDS